MGMRFRALPVIRRGGSLRLCRRIATPSESREFWHQGAVNGQSAMFERYLRFFPSHWKQIVDSVNTRHDLHVQNPSLLYASFTHPNYFNEVWKLGPGEREDRRKLHSQYRQKYDYLNKLGRSVLRLYLSAELYNNEDDFSFEGQMTMKREMLLEKQCVSFACHTLFQQEIQKGLLLYFHLPKNASLFADSLVPQCVSTDQIGETKPMFNTVSSKILSNTLHNVIATMFIESGYEQVDSWISTHVRPTLVSMGQKKTRHYETLSQSTRNTGRASIPKKAPATANTSLTWRSRLNQLYTLSGRQGQLHFVFSGINRHTTTKTINCKLYLQRFLKSHSSETGFQKWHSETSFSNFQKGISVRSGRFILLGEGAGIKKEVAQDSAAYNGYQNYLSEICKEEFHVGTTYLRLLHNAASAEDNDVIRQVCTIGQQNHGNNLAKLADVNRTLDSINQQTPMHEAARKNRCSTLELLHSYGGDVHARNDMGATPLWLAASQGHVESVICLHKLGGSLGEVNNHNIPPLDVAKKSGYTDIVNYILGHADDEKS